MPQIAIISKVQTDCPGCDHSERNGFVMSQCPVCGTPTRARASIAISGTAGEVLKLFQKGGRDENDIHKGTVL